MTEEQIRMIVQDELQKVRGLSAPISKMMEDNDNIEVLEVMMFNLPSEWGRRVVKRGDEVLLQSTEDKGITWRDCPIPEVKLVLPSSKVGARTLANNPYKGLIIENRNVQARSLSNDDKKLDTKVLESIESGSLLAKTEAKNDDGNLVENITFLGVYALAGLLHAQVWEDSQNYLRIAKMF